MKRENVLEGVPPLRFWGEGAVGWYCLAGAVTRYVECTGAPVSSQTYDAIFKEWLPTAPYEHAGPTPDAFERYPPQTDSGNTPVLVHIKVRDKETQP